MSLEGEKDAALYSYKCRKAENLGINPMLFDFIQKGADRDKTVQVLKELISYPWYEIIAKENNIEDPFDEKVVRAYWTGNKLSWPIKKEGGFLFPFHNFTVLYGLHSGKSTSVIDDCKISFGRITKVGEATLKVSYQVLIYEEKTKRFSLVPSDKKLIEKGFVKSVHEMDLVSFHYNIARKRLNEIEANLLDRLTKKAIKLFNEQHSSSK